MAHFSNGIEGECYQETVCKHCVHHGNCAVWAAHEAHNAKQIVNGEIDRLHPLQMLIPQDAKGLYANLCLMFYSLSATSMERAKAAWTAQAEQVK